MIEDASTFVLLHVLHFVYHASLLEQFQNHNKNVIFLYYENFILDAYNSAAILQRFKGIKLDKFFKNNTFWN